MSKAATLLSENIGLVTDVLSSKELGELPVLDLACGGGRNGKYLLSHIQEILSKAVEPKELKINVEFADRNDEALEQIKADLQVQYLTEGSATNSQNASFWSVDFEQPNFSELADKKYAGIMVFRYLHRDLFEQIKQAIAPGGFIMYETFTCKQAEFGRPKNPDFLLKPNELRTLFSDWQISHYFEGITSSESIGNSQAIAQLVAIKPS